MAETTGHSAWEPGTAGSPDSPEPGAVLRSPAASEPGIEVATDDAAIEVQWPWESESDQAEQTPQAVRQATPVMTEKLYRSKDYVPPAVSNPVAANDTMAPVAATSANAPSSAQTPASVPTGNGMSPFACFALITVVTAAAAFIDLWLNTRLTLITGITFVVIAIVGALGIRRRDAWMSVVVAPIAFLVALLIAGQPSTLGGSGDLLLKEGSLIVTGLAFNAPYIFGGTLAALIITLVRRPKK